MNDTYLYVRRHIPIHIDDDTKQRIYQEMRSELASKLLDYMDRHNTRVVIEVEETFDKFDDMMPEHEHAIIPPHDTLTLRVILADPVYTKVTPQKIYIASEFHDDKKTTFLPSETKENIFDKLSLSYNKFKHEYSGQWSVFGRKDYEF